MKYAFLLLLALMSSVYAFAQDFTVTNYTVDIKVFEAGYFDVVERYDLIFEMPKHGIYRDIQTTYDVLTEEGSKETRKLKISKVAVPNHTFKTPFEFQYNLSGTYQIKIGDASKTIIGAQHYEIRYRVSNAFLYESDGVKFYWNLKPSDWFASFNAIDFKIHLPSSVSINASDVFVYSGVTGTDRLAEDIAVSVADGVVEGKSKAGFKSDTGQSVTVLIKLPPNAIAESKSFWPFWTDYGWTLILGLWILGFYLIWKRYGKDDDVVMAVSYYPPKGMDPAMAGFLINDADDASDLISLIPYWGHQGYLKVEEIAKKNWFGSSDTKLIAIKALPQDVPSYERQLFNGLFGDFVDDSPISVLVSSLKDKFYTTMSSARSSLKNAAQPYYEVKARKVRYVTISGILGFGILLGILFLFVWGIFAVIGLVVVSAILLWMSHFLIKKNAKGNAALSELKGFKQFIKIAEINKLKMLIAEDPSYFESTMGFALSFGLFKNWAEKFDGLNLEPPRWYASTNGNFTMHHFTNSFASTMSSAQSTMVSSPSSSGSGWWIFWRWFWRWWWRELVKQRTFYSDIILKPIDMTTRRTFIKQVSLASGGLLLSTTSFGDVFSPYKKKVIIIGAGFSGLAAAYKLKQKNIDCVVLESRSRIGGRVFSHQMTNDLVVELGGEWVGNSHTRIQELCGEFKLELFNNQFDSHLIYKGEYSPAGQWNYSDDWNNTMTKMLEDYGNLSQQDKLTMDKMDWWRYLVQNGCDARDLDIRELLDSTDFGESIRHVSAYAALAEYAESSEKNEMDLKIRGGNNMLAERLAEKIGKDKILLKHTVTRIVQDDKVKVYCDNGTVFEADQLICSIPTFAMNKIDWQPGLPTEKVSAINELQYARINKHAMLFNDRFWKDENFDMITDQSPHYFYHATKNQKSQEGVLISYSIGEKAAVIANQSKESNANMVGTTLSPHFGDVKAKLKDQINYYWGTDMYSKGAYAMYGKDQWFRLRPILQEPFMNTQFCGEHLADWQGFMEGAINTGEAAAEAV